MKNPLTAIKERITQYFDLQLQSLKLSFLSKAAKIMGYLAFIFLAFVLGTLGMIFLCVSGAVYLGHLINNNWAAGFLVFGGFLVVMLVILLLLAGKITRFLGDKAVWLLTLGQEDEPRLAENAPEEAQEAIEDEF